MGDDEYLLRPLDRRELDRLGRQHEVWRAETDDVLRLAGFKKGDRLLDLGAGPGFLTFDLAEIVGPEGSVLAIDSSKTFHRHLLDEAERRELPWVRAAIADLRTYEFEPASFDGAITRWVLMFVPEVERAIAGVARALVPGAVFAAVEYAHFRSISLWPRGESFRRIYDAIHQWIARTGGDADIGSRMPELLTRAGFEIEQIVPIFRVGRPGTPLWAWLEATNKNHPNLVEAGLISDAELEAYNREWQEHATIPAAFFTAPPVLVTIARRTEEVHS